MNFKIKTKLKQNQNHHFKFTIILTMAVTLYPFTLIFYPLAVADTTLSCLNQKNYPNEKKLLLIKKYWINIKFLTKKRIADAVCNTCAGKYWRYLERYWKSISNTVSAILWYPILTTLLRSSMHVRTTVCSVLYVVNCLVM